MVISVLRNLPNSHTLKMQRRLYNNVCIGIAKRTLLYTVSQKNVPHSTCYNFDTHDPITIIFGGSVTENVRNHTMHCFPTSPV